MKLKLSSKFYFTLYFLILMLLFHREIKFYPYWKSLGALKGELYIFKFSQERFVIVVALFFINLNLLFRLNKAKLLFTVTSFFFLMITIPSMISFTSGSIYPLELLIYHQVFFLALIYVSNIKINLSKLPSFNKEQSLFLLISLTTIGILPYLIIWGPYINLNNLFLDDVYETRAEMGKVSNSYFGYTFSLFSKIIIPLIIVFSLELKKYYFAILGVFYLILFYLFGAHKTVYGALIVIFIFYKLSYFKAVTKTLKWSNILIIVSLVFASFGNKFDYLWILTFRRIHFVPSLLDICYIDFFKSQPLYWSESILKNFINYPLDDKHTYIIGEHYFNVVKMGSNNGLISDGYMNWGTIGVLINILIISGYFMILNNLNIPSKYYGLFLLVIFAFISSALSTVLLTHGAIFLLLISIFMLNGKKT